jgi:hypothetical protein
MPSRKLIAPAFNGSSRPTMKAVASDAAWSAGNAKILGVLKVAPASSFH